MFMRAVLSEEARVGLLSFDEPSAALDPAAEHGMLISISFNPCSELTTIRPVHADSEAQGREDDDFLIPSVWATN